MEENGETVCNKVPLHVILTRLKEKTGEKYPYKIYLTYQNVPVWLQEELNKMAREHNNRIDFSIDR